MWQKCFLTVSAFSLGPNVLLQCQKKVKDPWNKVRALWCMGNAFPKESENNTWTIHIKENKFNSFAEFENITK